MNAKPQILRKGRDPDCVHHEVIDAEMVGTCLRCDRVKSYRSIYTGHDDDPRSLMTVAALANEHHRARRDGVSLEARPRGGANERSAHWNEAGFRGRPAKAKN